MFPGTRRRYSVILVTVICEDRLLGLKKPSDAIFGLRIFVVAFLGLEILELIFLGGREEFDKKQTRGSHFYDK